MFQLRLSAARTLCAHLTGSLVLFLMLFPLALFAQSSGLTEAVPEQIVDLTSAEKTWIAAHPHIRVGVDQAWHPIEFVANGAHQGLSADYLALLNKRLGLNMKAVLDLTWPEVIEKTQNREIDILICVRPTPERNKYLSFTDYYIELPMSVFMLESAPPLKHLGQLNGRQVAVIEGYAEQELLTQHHPKIELVTVQNPEHGLRKVSVGEVDAYVGNIASGGYVARQLGLSNIKVARHTRFNYTQRIGVRKDWPELIGILNKGLRSIEPEEKKEIHERWIDVKYDVDSSQIWRTVGYMLSGTMLVLVLIFFWMRQLRRREARFRSLLESNPDGMIIVNRQGDITLVNARTEAIFGYTRTELVGKKIEILIPERFRENHPPKRDSFFADVSVQKAGASGLELLGCRRDGTEFPVEISLSPIQGTGNTQTCAVVRDITERKTAELELRKLSRAVEQSPTAIVITDHNGAIEYVNDRFAALSGYSSEEVLGQNPRILKSETMLPEFYRDLWKTISSGKFWHGEICNQTKKGQEIWVNVSISPVTNEEDEITHFVASYEDITERRLEEQKFRTIFNAPQEGIMLFDGEGIIDCNEATARMLDYDSREQVIGLKPYDISPETQPDGRSSEEKGQEMIGLAAKNGSHRFEWMHRKRTGDSFPVDVSLTAIELDNQPLILALLRDLTEQRQLQAQIKESQEQLDLAMQASGLGLWDFRLHTKELYFNDQLAEMLGYKKDELSKDLAEWVANIHPDDLESHQAVYDEHARGNTPSYRSEHRLRTKNGEYKWILDIGRAVDRDAEGNPMRLVGIHMDIQEQKELQARLQALSERSQAQARQDSSLATLAADLQGNLPVDEVAARGLSAIVEFIDAPVGAFYVLEEDGDLHRRADHALPPSAESAAQFPVGIGSVGQVARSKQLQVSEPRSDHWTVDFGIGRLSPQQVITFPLISNDDLTGVVELCLFDALDDIRRLWLNRASEIIATALRFARSTHEQERAEQKLKALFAALPVGVVMIDPSGQIVEANKISEEILGISADEHKMRELQSQDWKIVRSDGTLMPVEEYPASRALSGEGEIRNVEMGVHRPQGDLIWINTSAAPIDRAVGGGVAVAFEDITEHRKMIEALEAVGEEETASKPTE